MSDDRSWCVQLYLTPYDGPAFDAYIRAREEWPRLRDLLLRRPDATEAMVRALGILTGPVAADRDPI